MNKLLFFALLLFSVCGQAQSDISRTLKESLEKKMDNVNVLFLRSPDSGLVKGVLTDAKGIFLFHSIPAGYYFVQSTYTGFIIDNSVPFSIVADRNPKGLGIIHLYENSTHSISMNGKD